MLLSHGAAQTVGAAPRQGVQIDAISLILDASGPVFVVVWSLIAAAVLVWFIAVLKLLQLGRLNHAQMRFEHAAGNAKNADELFDAADRMRDAPGARVVLALEKRAGAPMLLEATARRAIVEEQKRASSLIGVLGSIGSAAPFVGLFGTVYGIMEAFIRIGQEKSASLPVVAPAIGEALIATAIGLVAAIPAVVAYNTITKRLDDLLSAIEASAEGWVALSKVPASLRASGHPPAQTPARA